MRIRTYGAAAVVLAVLLVAAAGFAALNGGKAATDGAETALQFEGVWARAASAGHMSAAYMTIVNTGEAPVDIVAVQSDAAGKAEVHETTTEITFVDGKISQTMRMEAVGTLTVAPGATVTLKPGGLHIMLIGLTRDVEEGDTLALALELGTGERIVLDVPVTVGAGGDDHDHHDHDNDHDHHDHDHDDHGAAH